MTKKTKPLRERPDFKRLQRLLQAKEVKPPLTWYHAVGACVAKLFPKGNRRYGQNVMDTLADELGANITVKNMLWAAREFFSAYEREEVGWLQDPENTNGFRFTWSHMKALTPIKEHDEEFWAKLQQQCIANKWSLKRLRQEIQAVRGKRSFGGVPLSQAETVEEGIFEMAEKTDDWLNRCAVKWLSPGSLDKRGRGTAEGLQRRLDLIDRADEGLGQMLGAIEDARGQLRSLRRRTTQQLREKVGRS